MWQKGGDGHQDGDPEEAAPREAEERPQKPVEEAQADGMRGAVQGSAEEGAEHHDPDDDEKKGDDLSGRRRGDEASEEDRATWL